MSAATAPSQTRGLLSKACALTQAQALFDAPKADYDVAIYTSSENNAQNIASALQNNFCANLFALDCTRIFSNLHTEMPIQDRDSIHNSVYEKIVHGVGAHNICFSPQFGIFLLAIFTQVPLVPTFYVNLLAHSLSKFFDEDQLAEIVILSEPESHSEAEITNFLQRNYN